MQALEEKAKEGVLKSIKAAAVDYGKRNGFAAVLAKEDMLYMSDAVGTEDITDKVIKVMDEKKAK
jgi:Skp family chaperone for outer membrane proteins